MAWRDTLDRAASEIGQRMGQEFDNARDAMSQVFDLRLRSGESFLKENSPGLQYDMSQQQSPAPDPEQSMEVEPER